MEGFAADLEAAERLLALCGLNVGSIDFIGDSINEINGCGTIFTEYKNWQCIVDARPALVRNTSSIYCRRCNSGIRPTTFVRAIRRSRYSATFRPN